MPLKQIPFHYLVRGQLDTCPGGRQTLKVVRLLKACAVVCALETICSLAMWGQAGVGPTGAYGGPAVMGRSMGAGIAPRMEQVRFRFFGSVRGVYDSGLTAARITPNGERVNANGLGYEFNGGIYGMKAWRQTQLFLGYVGGYRNYVSSASGSGSNHSLNLGLSHQVNQRLSFQSTIAGSTINRAYGFGNGFVRPGQESDPAFNFGAMNEVYDSRMYMVSNSNSLIYQLSARSQVSATGGYFLNKRSRSLISAAGVFANGDYSRRITRTQTISVNYNFNQFNYSGQYGNSFIQGVGLGWSMGLGRRWELALNGGATLVESDSLRTVLLDPEVAAIIGQPTGTEAVYRRSYYPNYQARLMGRFRRSSVSGGYRQTILPGNGAFLTSRVESASGAYNFNGIRKVNFAVVAQYNRLHNLMLTSARASNLTAGFNVGYQLRHDLQATLSVMGRRFESPTSNYNADGVRIAIGLAYSPGEVPLALW